MAPWIPLFALIVACLAVMADAVSTREALRNRNLYERNKLRAFLIRTLGINGGTYGVAVAICAALVFSYSPQSNVAGISYATVACFYIYVVFNNLQVARRLSK